MKFKYSLFYCIVNFSKRTHSCDVDFLEFNFLNEKFDHIANLSQKSEGDRNISFKWRCFLETKALSRVEKCASYLLSYATNDLTVV